MYPVGLCLHILPGVLWYDVAGSWPDLRSVPGGVPVSFYSVSSLFPHSIAGAAKLVVGKMRQRLSLPKGQFVPPPMHARLHELIFIEVKQYKPNKWRMKMFNGIIIAAKATKDCGKTTAIRSILFYLTKRHNAKVMPHPDLNPDLNNKYPGVPGDVSAILEYQNIKIGISSMGDSGPETKKLLDIFIKNDCNIIVCACHSWGATMAPIVALTDSWNIQYVYPVNHGFISIDQMWNELTQAIRLIKLVRAKTLTD